MDNRIALVGIVVQTPSASQRLNAVLHEFGNCIVGRMGVPYRQRGISIISIIVDAPATTISAMTGKLGMIAGVAVKTMYAKEGDANGTI